MANEYIHEFTEQVSLDEFQKWLECNSKMFGMNMFGLGKDKDTKELRDWIQIFLLWSEYEDNKYGNQD